MLRSCALRVCVTSLGVNLCRFATAITSEITTTGRGRTPPLTVITALLTMRLLLHCPDPLSPRTGLPPSLCHSIPSSHTHVWRNFENVKNTEFRFNNDTIYNDENFLSPTRSYLFSIQNVCRNSGRNFSQR